MLSMQLSPDGEPEVGGVLVYNHSSGAFIGLVAINVEQPFGLEFNQFIGYSYKKESVTYDTTDRSQSANYSETKDHYLTLSIQIGLHQH